MLIAAKYPACDWAVGAVTDTRLHGGRQVRSAGFGQVFRFAQGDGPMTIA
jgi:hypothetical protein